MLLTIITATYNSAETVEDTLRSVLAQTFRDYELLVIDGQSGDGTMDIVRRYEARFGGRLRWVSEPDKGLYDAMNKGLRLAKGDVVGILNSDDFYTSPDVLQHVADAFAADAALDAVYGDVHFVHPDDLGRCTRYYSSRHFHRRWMRLGFMPAHPSFYCRRAVYEEYGAFDLGYRVAADFESLLRFIYVHRIRTRYLPLDFVTMRTGGASTSGLQSHRRIMSDHLRALRQNGVRSNVALLSLRYVYKVCEVVLTRLRRKG